MAGSPPWQFQSKILAFGLTVIFSLTGVAYTNVTSRVSDLENGRKDFASINTTLQVQTAVLTQQIKTIEANRAKLDSQLEVILASQQANAEELQSITSQLALLRQLFGRDEQAYQEALRRWQDLVQQQSLKRKK